MDQIRSKAREIGRLLAQTEEYRALRRANEGLGNDREAVDLINRIGDLQDRITEALRRGEEPGEDEQTEYERTAERLQGLSGYQKLVAAQSNFDRLMVQVNEEIGKGIEAGEQSRIILPD
jgi:cell fate (sporulation/competence/biofilm development) regulator YlbF (YheA/YmcA/DUF963 family)